MVTLRTKTNLRWTSPAPVARLVTVRPHPGIFDPLMWLVMALQVPGLRDARVTIMCGELVRILVRRPLAQSGWGMNSVCP